MDPFDTTLDLYIKEKNLTDANDVLKQIFVGQPALFCEEEGRVSFEYSKKERRPAFRYRPKKHLKIKMFSL